MAIEPSQRVHYHPVCLHIPLTHVQSSSQWCMPGYPPAARMEKNNGTQRASWKEYHGHAAETPEPYPTHLINLEDRDADRKVVWEREAIIFTPQGLASGWQDPQKARCYLSTVHFF